MQSRDPLVLLLYLVKGRNALTMASRDMSSACGAEVKDIDQERCKSAYNCSVSMLKERRGAQDGDSYDKYLP